MRRLRRAGLVVVALVGAVPVLLLAVATAWLGSNLGDIAPRPRPAVLQLPQAAVADDRNVFFALAGLSAEPGRDPAAAGQALWQITLEQAALTPHERLNGPKAQALRDRDSTEFKRQVSAPAGPLLTCSADVPDCVNAWLAQPAAVAAERQAMALVGARCDALAQSSLEFEERIPPRPHYAAAISPHTQGALACARWWRSGAVLAWKGGQAQAAVTQLERAVNLSAMLLTGGHSLISHMLSASITRDTQSTIVALGLRDPALATALTPLLDPAPGAANEVVQTQAVQRWMAVEAAISHSALAEAFECLEAADTGPTPFLDRLIARVSHWQCGHRIGLQAESTLALADDFWAGTADALGGGLPAAVQHLDARLQQAQVAGWRWRNTVGHILIDVALPAHAQYVRQAADLPLHTEAAALVLAAAAQQVPAAERAAWAQRQAMSATLRERSRWDPSGQVFAVRTWYEEGRTTPIEPRQAIRFTWPTATQG